MTEAEQIRTLAEAHRIMLGRYADWCADPVKPIPSLQAAHAISQAIARLASCIGLQSVTVRNLEDPSGSPPGCFEYKEGP